MQQRSHDNATGLDIYRKRETQISLSFLIAFESTKPYLVLFKIFDFYFFRKSFFNIIILFELNDIDILSLIYIKEWR